MDDPKTETFERHRRTLEGLAYRMLGTLGDASDVVQDTWLKWQSADPAAIENPRAWLITVCSRLAVNQLQSARVRRERYPGTWLPEPWVEPEPNALARLELDESLSVALLLTLETLTPAERAAWLLHEVFDYSFDEIAAVLNKSSANCRQLASRARQRLTENKPRFDATPERHHQLLSGFLAAAREGNVERLMNLLADDARLHADGGGKATTAAAVLTGPQAIARFFVGVWAKLLAGGVRLEGRAQWYNGTPGMLIVEDDKIVAALSFDVHNDRIVNVYALRNPDKLVPFGEGEL